MARPIKNGLDYFPLDVGFFSDIRIRRLRSRYGTDGIAVYVYILCEIYRNGYYIDYDDDLILDISDELNLSENVTRQIMNYLLSRSLFDGTLAKSVKILTAASIQRRFQEAKKGCKRDIGVVASFWLLEKEDTESFIKVRPYENKSEKNDSKSENNHNNSEKNETKKSKVKKSKVNESSVCVPHGTHGHTQEEVSTVISTLGYAWDDEEIQRFLDLNNELGWMYSLEYAVKRWEKQRKHFQNGKSGKPEPTKEELKLMDAYAPMMNRFRKEDG